MRTQLLTSIGALGVVVSLLVLSGPIQITAENAGPIWMTPWGEPNLRGIWTVESDTPLQRPSKYTNQEFFTEAQARRVESSARSASRQQQA